MKKYCILFLSLIFTACNNQQKDISTNSSTADTDSKRQTENSSVMPKFKILPFDKNTHFFKDSIKGELVDGLHWMDAEGESIAVFTSTAVNMNKEGMQEGSLYAYCFNKMNNQWKRKWEVKDRINDCEVEATCEFFSGSFSITDNDNNNFGEATFVYKLSCKGDVSPDEKKLIMYEGTKKYAIRGNTIIIINGTKNGGNKNTDAAFSNAPKPLLDFANAQWDKFGTTTY